MEIFIKLLAVWIFFRSFSWIKEGLSRDAKMEYQGKKGMLVRIYRIIWGIGLLLGSMIIFFDDFS